MSPLWLTALIVLWLVVLLLGFLLLGALRALGLVSWRLEQLEATTPKRLGRDGLKVGARAPDFRLPNAAGIEQALSDFAGHRVLLVFTQSGCGPCRDIIPELNRISDRGDHQVIVVNNGALNDLPGLATDGIAKFPVLIQEHFGQSRRYQVFATPFAFLIDELGVIVSKGIAGSRKHLGYVLAGTGGPAKRRHVEASSSQIEKSSRSEPYSSKEVSHV
jgi:methylamine dehydrogenase accessory protein MauD